MADVQTIIDAMRCELNAGEYCYSEDCPYYTKPKCREELFNDIAVLLKEQEKEIKRLKSGVPCSEAERTAAGCLGFGKGPSDDEPIEACKSCKEYVSFGIE